MTSDEHAARRGCVRVLVIDDDEALASSLSLLIAGYGYDCVTASSAAEGLRVAASTARDVVLVAASLPDGSAPDVLARILAQDPLCAVVLMTDDAQAAVDAVRGGAVTGLTKPATEERILLALEEACQRRLLRLRVAAATRDARPPLGASPAWQRVVAALHEATRAPRTPALLTGEPGTGKELAASTLHAWSDRARGPFVSATAAGLAPQALERELFGHGADQRGLLELACGGTLFLDEIGELPIELHPALLRAIEGQPFHRVDGERAIRVDVRFVAATTRDLPAAVAAGRLPLDGYRRLGAITIALPPLRERGDDVELLAAHFVSTLSAELGKPGVTLSADALTALRGYAWPANVRELRNVIERALVVCRGGEIRRADLPRELRAPPAGAPAEGASRPLRLDEVIRRHVLEVFGAHDDNVTRTARALGISRVALRRRLREYGAKPPPS